MLNNFDGSELTVSLPEANQHRRRRAPLVIEAPGLDVHRYMPKDAEDLRAFNAALSQDGYHRPLRRLPREAGITEVREYIRRLKRLDERTYGVWEGDEHIANMELILAERSGTAYLGVECEPSNTTRILLAVHGLLATAFDEQETTHVAAVAYEAEHDMRLLFEALGMRPRNATWITHHPDHGQLRSLAYDIRGYEFDPSPPTI